jgi:hypothetical protein
LFIDPIEIAHMEQLAPLLVDRDKALNLLLSQHLGAQRDDVVRALGNWVLDTVDGLLSNL